MQILITGFNGFVGRNLSLALARRPETAVRGFEAGDAPEVLRQGLAEADVIFHLAGVNRPPDPADYAAGNAGFTAELCAGLRALNRAPKIVFSSSIQAELDNPYGVSKRQAEAVLRAYAADSGAEVVVHRFKNLFGKWCRPNYNSVTATFCHNIARDLPITVSNPAHELDLTYIDEVVQALLGDLTPAQPGYRLAAALPSFRVTLGQLAETLRGFRASRQTLRLPDFADPFIRALYATYSSYLPETDFAYGLEIKADARGSLAEFLKTPGAGQVFISRTRPGITRGNHYHHTKVEKFLVVQGEAVIRFRSLAGGPVQAYRVRGEEYRVVDIPTGYTHSIENVGPDELVTLFWADEIFDPQRADTYYEEV